jgi:hypothetical protein
MTSESQQEPVGSPSVRVLVPSYLPYFAILPIIATFVLSAIDPMAGMALLTCFLVMALVLRFFTRVEKFRREYVPPDNALDDLVERSPAPVIVTEEGQGSAND